MWDTNQTILFYHEDAGVGFEVDARCFLYDCEAFYCDVRLVAETKAY